MFTSKLNYYNILNFLCYLILCNFRYIFVFEQIFYFMICSRGCWKYLWHFFTSRWNKLDYCFQPELKLQVLCLLWIFWQHFQHDRSGILWRIELLFFDWLQRPFFIHSFAYTLWNVNGFPCHKLSMEKFLQGCEWNEDWELSFLLLNLKFYFYTKRKSWQISSFDLIENVFHCIRKE